MAFVSLIRNISLLKKFISKNKVNFSKISFLFGLTLMAFSTSWLCPLLVSNLMKNNFIEIALFPALLLMKFSNSSFSKNIFYIFRTDIFITLFASLVLFLLIGLHNTNFDFGSVYSDFRANLLFLIIFVWFYRYFDWSETNIKILVIWLVLNCMMDLVALYLRPYFVVEKSETVKQTISIIVPTILSIYFLNKNKFFYMTIFFSIVILEAILGFYRNYYLITVLVFVIIVISLFRNIYKKGGYRLILYIFIIVLLIVKLYPYVYEYWQSDSSRQVHSINRTEELLSGKSSEQERVNSTLILFSDPGLFVFPNGLGWKSFVIKIQEDFKFYKIISSMDSSPFYIAYHYGIFIFYIVMFILFYLILKSFILEKRQKELFPIETRFIFLVIFFSSFLTQGVMLTTIPGAFSYSLLLAISLKSIRISNAKNN